MAFVFNTSIQRNCFRWICILVGTWAISCLAFDEIDRAKLAKQLERHEGKRSKVYLDSEGIPTIGIGFNLKRSDAKAKIESLGLDYQQVLDGKQELTDAQIQTLFDADISASIAECKKLYGNFDELSEVRQRVLADMMFNLGPTRLAGFKKMAEAIKAKDFPRAADEMRNSKWYEQVKVRGVTLVEMMRTDNDPPWLEAESISASVVAVQDDLPDLSAWRNVLSFRPAAETQDVVKGMGSNWAVHRIEDAKGDVNLDIYSVEISRFPVVKGAALTPEQLVQHIRLNLNDFIDQRIAEFRPFDEANRARWEDATPTGAILLIDMKLWGISPDSGCVVTTLRSPREWIFSTVRSGHPIAALIGNEAAAHPVSGNRAFGIYRTADGKHVFYSVAADRPTQWIDEVMAERVVFKKADELWQSMQEKVVKFINDNSGAAAKKTAQAMRYKWDAVSNSKYYAIEDQPVWK